jgi:hypothetical protein
MRLLAHRLSETLITKQR